jgi:hypothetical protein
MRRTGCFGSIFLLFIAIILVSIFAIAYGGGGLDLKDRIDGGSESSHGTLFLATPSTVAAIEQKGSMSFAPQDGKQRIASALPSALPQGSPLQGSQSPAHWDEQLGLSFTQDFTSLAYNVTAVEQADLDGIGPSYLLNGLTNEGYWYQVGLSWNWPYVSGGHDQGFYMNYEVFGASGNSIYPSNGEGGLASITGTVNQGDTVGLFLYFSKGNVTMSVYDFNTGAHAQDSFSAEGSTVFDGTPDGKGNSNGFFTGLMTEQYHISQYYGDESTVLYSDTTFSLNSAWMWIDEYNTETQEILFNDQTSVVYSSPSLQSLSSNGATENSNASDFITGTGTWVPMTMDFGTMGDGLPASSPVLNYTFGGTEYSDTLTLKPTTYYMDYGSTWSVTNPLPGGFSGEEWRTAQPTAGVVNSSLSLEFNYYDQYLLTFDYNTSGENAGFAQPNVTIMQCGVYSSVEAPYSTYVDSGSQYSYQNPIPTSLTGERWATAVPQGYAYTSLTVDPLYYHQYALNTSYSVIGGGTPGPILLSGVSFGSPVSVQLSETAETIWLDAGSGYSLPASINSTETERWYASSELNGSITGPFAFSPAYQHQFYLNLSSYSEGGGSLTPSNGWVVAGQSVQINAVPSTNWQFEGWTGVGPLSYSGNLSSTSFSMESPVQEYAQFYPGLIVSAMGSGTVSYSYSQKMGSVAGGTSFTLYAPQNSSISLTAAPSSFFFQFDKWSGAINSSSPTTSLVLTAPGQIQARFILNWVNIGILATAIAAAGGIGGWIGSRKRRH